jgi:hypothetical protein
MRPLIAGHQLLLLFTALGLLSPLTSVAAQRRFRPDMVIFNESGTGSGSLRGVEVSIDRSGNAAVFKANGSTWSVKCEADDTTELRSCSLIQQYRQPALLVWKGEKGSVYVSVGTDLFRRPYPYTDVDLRIDGGEAYTAQEPGWNAAQSALIVRALRKGKAVVTSYTEWPSDNYALNNLDLDGFDVAMEFVDFAVTKSN